MAEAIVNNPVAIGAFRVGKGQPLAFIAGPCVLEDDRTMLETAEQLAALAQRFRIPLVFKASYEKDNRSEVTGYRGPGLEEGLELLAHVREVSGLPVTSDVHRESDVAAAAEVLDLVQIPAFLCQQTSLLVAAGRACRAVNVKKGQFMAPENMRGAVGKIHQGGCDQILLTERGSCFGYNRLVADVTSVPIMQGIGCPVVFDVTHIGRRYGIPSSDRAGGLPEHNELLARCGAAAGADALFIETHPCPAKARCDAASMLPLSDFASLLQRVLPIAESIRTSVPEPGASEVSPGEESR